MSDHDSRSVPSEAPVILDRSRHSISRRHIDPDALKVLYRLHNHGFIAFLVGGAVRDLLLGKTPKDFDVGTDARPRQIKKLFRNSFLIGRRFRLAHVRFQGGKVIEVATFRRDPDLGEEPDDKAERNGSPADGETEEETVPGAEPEGEAAFQPEGFQPAGPESAPKTEAPVGPDEEGAGGRRLHPPAAFGSPRQDAFRRDITINALFYDIATFSVIDYVGGLEDLERKRVRIIGPPAQRFVEDPVRMWRALRHAARLGFSLEEETERALAGHIALLSGCPGSRLYEELNKSLKSGAAVPLFSLMRKHGLFVPLFGLVGALYEDSGEAFDSLSLLLGVIDRMTAGGKELSAVEMYGLFLHPWAAAQIAQASGDRGKMLHEAFRVAAMPTTIPKALSSNALQILIIAQRMLRALETGMMRWSMRHRSHYAQASRLCGILREGRLMEADDPFEMLFRRRFGAEPSFKKKRARRRRGRKRNKTAGSDPSAKPGERAEGS